MIIEGIIYGGLSGGADSHITGETKHRITNACGNALYTLAMHLYKQLIQACPIYMQCYQNNVYIVYTCVHGLTAG